MVAGAAGVVLCVGWLEGANNEGVFAVVPDGAACVDGVWLLGKLNPDPADAPL